MPEEGGQVGIEAEISFARSLLMAGAAEQAFVGITLGFWGRTLCRCDCEDRQEDAHPDEWPKNSAATHVAGQVAYEQKR